MTRIWVDEAAELVLAQQGLTVESVPDAGQVVRLRTNSNLSTGGSATDVTDVVHPANAQVAQLAATAPALPSRFGVHVMRLVASKSTMLPRASSAPASSSTEPSAPTQYCCHCFFSEL